MRSGQPAWDRELVAGEGSINGKLTMAASAGRHTRGLSGSPPRPCAPLDREFGGTWVVPFAATASRHLRDPELGNPAQADRRRDERRLMTRSRGESLCHPITLPGRKTRIQRRVGRATEVVVAHAYIARQARPRPGVMNPPPPPQAKLVACRVVSVENGPNRGVLTEFDADDDAQMWATPAAAVA